MKVQQAIDFIQAAIPQEKGKWADIGAGTGTFTLALDQLLPKGSTIYSIDKKPTEQQLSLQNCVLETVKQDFDEAFDLPIMDGIIMANTLHYSEYPVVTLNNILKILKTKGRFILIEYELTQARKPWIPYPITFQQFCEMATQVALSTPLEIRRLPSTYGNNYMYLASCEKREN